MGSVAVDGPTLFMQGTILRARRRSRRCVMAERQVDPAGDCVRPARLGAARLGARSRSSPGSAGCRPRSGRCSCSASAACCSSRRPTTCSPCSSRSRCSRCRSTCWPGSPVVVACSRRRPRSSTSCSAPSPRRSSSTAPRCSTASPAPSRSAASPSALTALGGRHRPACIAGIALLAVGPAVQDRRRAVPPVDARTSTRARPTSITGFMAAVHQGRRVRRAAARHVRRARRHPLGLAPDDVRDRRAHDDRRHALRADPDRHQAHARLLLDRARRLHARRRHRDQRGGPRRARCSTCWPTASPRSAPSRSSRWCATPTGEATHLSQWAGPRQALAAGRRAPSRCSCWPSPASRSPAASPGSSRSSPRASPAAPPRWSCIGVLASAVAAFFYIRVIVLMFFTEPAAEGGAERGGAEQLHHVRDHRRPWR